MNQIVQIFKALGDETRLKMLIILSKRRICAKGLSKHLDISEAAVSQHLKVLKEAGIITGEKSGYFVQYNIQNSALLEITRFIEQMKGPNDVSSTYYDIPVDCKAACKANQNKCCHKI